MPYSTSGLFLHRLRLFISFCVLGVLLAACGGGGGGGGGGTVVAGGTAVTTWGAYHAADISAFFTGSRGGGNAGAGGSGANGGAGDGAPIRNATVKITDSTSPTSQVATATTGTDGYYQADITGFKPPLIASVTYKDAAGVDVTRYSPSVSTLVKDGFITINITGLTTYIAAKVAIAAGGSGAVDLTPTMLADASALTKATSDLRAELISKLSPALQTEIANLGLNLATFDPISAVYIPSTTSGYDTILENVSASQPTSSATTLTAKLPTDLAKAMFTELVTTWGTSLSPASATINQFLYDQTTQTRADVNASVFPNTGKVQSRFTVLSKAIQLYEDAKAYTPTNTLGLTVGTLLPDATGQNFNATGLYRISGSADAVFGRYGDMTNCWTDGATGATTTTASCFYADPDSYDASLSAGGSVRGVLFVVTPGATASTYNYTATRYNVPLSVATSNRVTIAPATKVTVDTASNPIPAGTGSVTRTMSGSTITALTMTGTFPPSATAASFNEVVTAGVDTLNISAQRTALATPANSYHYALNGSISTTSLANPSKVSSESFDTGSYIDVDETNAASGGTGGAKVLIGKIIGTVQTTASKFTGTFDLSAPSADADGLNYIATHVIFNGSISNLAGPNQGQFLTGKLDLVVNNYSAYHATTGDTATNYAHGVANFTGTLQAPSRPLMTVTTTLTKIGMTTGTATMKYSYGLDVEVNGTSTVNNATGIKPTLTLTNQNGVVVVLDTNTYTGTVTMPTVTGTVLGTIGAGVVNYNDGVTASTNFN